MSVSQFPSSLTGHAEGKRHRNYTMLRRKKSPCLRHPPTSLTAQDLQMLLKILKVSPVVPHLQAGDVISTGSDWNTLNCLFLKHYIRRVYDERLTNVAGEDFSLLERLHRCPAHRQFQSGDVGSLLCGWNILQCPLFSYCQQTANDGGLLSGEH